MIKDRDDELHKFTRKDKPSTSDTSLFYQVGVTIPGIRI